jgi:polyisoprenoid-binding protein YceI
MESDLRKEAAVVAVIGMAVLATGAAAREGAGAARPAADSTVLVTAPEGNSARYRVREQLVGFDLPNDAVGATNAVTGTLVLLSDGTVSPASKFVVDVRPLKSDKDRRDGFVQSRLLETRKYPTVDLAVTAVGIEKYPLPSSGALNFLMHGNLTVRGVTKPTLWRVNAQIADGGGTVTGTASTAFTFEDFQITRPRVPIVLSVADTIRLEYDFKLVSK